MSLNTWMKEFYPVNAEEVPREDAISHSLRKWEGLQPEALAKHKVKFKATEGYIQDRHSSLDIDDSTCALCAHHIDANCESCPLQILLDGRCDEFGGPYSVARYNKDVQPMLNSLRRLSKIEQAIKGPSTGGFR